MPTPDVHAFVRASLPPPPARVLEIGAGAGDLATALGAAGYDVVAIDPAAGAPHVLPVPLLELEERDGSFAAAVAVVSLHHVEPLAESVEHLAALLASGAPLVVDEFDVGAYDEAAARWWLAQAGHDHDPAALVGDLREHLHALEDIVSALRPWFEVGAAVRGPYLYRWEIDPASRGDEEAAIAAGAIPATGARLIATRGSRGRAGRRRPRA